MGKTWDYVIVGAGSAGSTLAGRLSENPERTVLLVEAGGWDTSPLIRIPGLLERALTSDVLNWSYVGEADPSLDGRRLTWAAGRAIGGSSSINGMVYGRGLPIDYDRWVQAGNPGWSWQDMLPYFKRLEHWTGAPGASRGSGGPLWVRRFEETDAACAATMEALVRLGAPSVEDYCSGIVEGVDVTQATQRRGWRHSAASAYLHPARSRPNLSVLTGALALNLLIEGPRCTGVRAARRGRLLNLHADRETIVCAGAIGTPKLLMLSGVGPADSLKSHGIAVHLDLPGVGSNLNDHVNIKLSAFVDRKTYNTRRSGLSVLSAGMRLVAFGSGPASSPANHVQAFVRTDPTSPHADVQLQVMPFGFGTSADMARDGVTVVVSPCHPDARGKVSLRGADPAAPPRIEIALLESARDREKLLRGCKFAALALREGPGRSMGGRLYAPTQAEPTDPEWLASFRQTAALNWHPTSTCRMGPGADAVVDNALNIHGLAGVSIVDASVMPTVTSANTNAPVIAIAERAAEMIAARTR
jgi:choline dehydrogenase